MEQILILGAKGILGGQLLKIIPNAIGWDRNDIDITRARDLKLKIENLDTKPEIIINCVAYNDVDGAEENKDLAFQLNAEAVKNLVVICKELSVPLMHFSTNYVFDGVRGEYEESDVPNPQSIYAKSKYLGEQEIQKHINEYYLIRTAVIFGPKARSRHSKKSFVELMLELAEKRQTIRAVNDEINSLTYVIDLANQVKVLLEQQRSFDIYHITNSGQASWYDFAKEIFTIVNKKVNLISVSSSEFPRKVRRPKKAVLINTKLPSLRPWQTALKEFLLTSNK